MKICAIGIAAGLCAAPAVMMGQYIEPRWQPEARLEVLTARTTAVHGAVGANAVVGMYGRFGLLVGAGARLRDDRWRASGSVSAMLRFHVDPYRESARGGVYAGGGGTLLLDADRVSRVRAAVVLGFEGRVSKRRWIAGAELGVGGGARIALTLRRAREHGR